MALIIRLQQSSDSLAICNYLQLFQLMQKYVPAYIVEAPKLLKLLVFNYLFSNGDAHFKNFSLLKTPIGDYRLSPASFEVIKQIMLSGSEKVKELTFASYLDQTTKRNYWQSYEGRLRQLEKT
ncbi:MAG: HipA domain-containing protein [Pseudobacter sp.]|uniref:HipA domain-containing protein n=1 Tax=Pseudobacter sp. TaxID=2045420 RepID=UPI003F81356E